jgi:hypothetical protein
MGVLADYIQIRTSALILPVPGGFGQVDCFQSYLRFYAVL